MREDFSNRVTTIPPFQREKLIDYNELYQLVHTEKTEGELNYYESVTSYSYT